MAQARRISLTGAEKAELWGRWKRGESMREIARALGRGHTTVRSVVNSTGGFAPAPRRRAQRCLSLREREEISRGIAAGLSNAEIARELERSPSTISRELARHQGRERYRAAAADGQAWENARRPKGCRLASRPRLRRAIARKLRLEWSPQQIARWLKREFSADPQMQLSHETIYRTLFVQARGLLKKQLHMHLRTQRGYRHAQLASTLGQGRGQIVDAISIRERPAEVADRAVPGHWEGDLIIGANSSQVGTLVERYSRYVMLIKLDTKDANTVATALSKHVLGLPEQLRRSLTWDRGMEMAKHKEFTIATDVQVYFCDPRSPWQRGSNENTNGLLRQYLPRTADISTFSQRHLNAIAARLNQRPRMTLGWISPAEKLNESVASTG